VVFGVARMYSLLAEGLGGVAEVFRDVESASRWLNRMAAKRE